MENQPTKLDKAVKIATLVGVIIVSLSIAYYFISKSKNSYNTNNVNISNQNSEEAQVKKDFADAFNLRIVGNCDLFADSVSKKDSKIREVWGERCRQEKTNSKPLIQDFSIKRVSVENEKAYIQAELTKNVSGKDFSYTAAYELTKEDGVWKLIMPADEK